MTEKLIKLSTEELSALGKVFQKSKQNANLTILAVVIVFIFLSVIPTGIISLFSSSYTDTDDGSNPKLNLIQHWGFGIWLLVFLVLSGASISGILYGNRIFRLKRDLKEQEKREMEVEVTSKDADHKNQHFHMGVKGELFGNKRIELNYEQFNQFSIGQKVSIEVFKNSNVLIPKKTTTRFSPPLS